MLTEKYHFWHLYTTNPEIYFIFLNEKNLKRTMKRKAGWMGMERKERRSSLSSEKKRFCGVCSLNREFNQRRFSGVTHVIFKKNIWANRLYKSKDT